MDSKRMKHIITGLLFSLMSAVGHRAIDKL